MFSLNYPNIKVLCEAWHKAGMRHVMPDLLRNCHDTNTVRLWKPICDNDSSFQCNKISECFKSYLLNSALVHINVKIGADFNYSTCKHNNGILVGKFNVPKSTPSTCQHCT